MRRPKSYNRAVNSALLLAAALAVPTISAAASGDRDPRVDHEEWRVIGWDDACGVALTKLSYPVMGDALSSEPISARVGMISLPPDQEKSSLRWTLEADGVASWDERAINGAVEELKTAGYRRIGYPETVRATVGKQPLLAETLTSTRTFQSRLRDGWPGPDWRLAGANINPLATCALLAFEKRDAPRRYAFALIHVYNPRIRLDRAYAHASNARLLFNDGDLDTAYLESETAVALAPELAIARYGHAAMLALTGRQDRAVRELAAAVKLDHKYAEKAREDIDFRDLRGREDFKEALR